jgi:mono/diheme cytochrome c family protein
MAWEKRLVLSLHKFRWRFDRRKGESDITSLAMRNVLLFCAVALPALPQAGAANVDPEKLPPAATRPVDFTRDVQPIFEATCWNCHGPKRAESSFRLDQRADALKGGERGNDVIPGKSGESLLIHAVSGLHDELKMPKKGEKLTAEQVGILRAWIDQGAQMPEKIATGKDPAKHWAFKAPVRPAVPKVQSATFKIQNPIDAFVLARLQNEKLKPSPEADKVTLIRRLYLDLIGLPPKPEDVDAFLADKSKDAYDKVVKALLASPHYGERWGRHWLDAARYADSDGYEKDMSREMWPYRDYVVNAFNRDLPYNQFLIEQLAGDQLPHASQDQVVATGFLRNSMVNMEGAIDPEQFRMDAMFDRMDAIGKAMLGLTIQCAQCHSHKYDPISQDEYYRMFAFINSDHEARPVVYTPDQQMKIAGLRDQMSEIEDGLKHRTPDWETRMAEWEDSVKGNQPEWIVFGDLNQEGDKSQRYEDKKDGSWLACGYAPTKFTQWFRITNDLDGVTAFQLELLTDPNLPYDGPGRAFNGTCALSEFYVEAMDAKFPTNKARVKWKEASADVEQPERSLEKNFDDKTTNSRITGPISFAIDGNDKTAWGINIGPVRRNQDRKAVFVAAKPAGFTNGTYWRIGLNQNHGGWNSDDHMNNNLGRFRVSATKAPGGAKADPVPKKVRDIFKIPKEKRTPVQVATVFSYWRTTVPAWKEANAKIEALWSEYPDGATAMTLLARRTPRETHVLRRGDWLKPQRTVTPGVPAFLHPLPKNADDSRLTFARWIADRKSPTTARVFVNRVWQAYFGIGLVSTPEDFGMQSDAPSHPELLDWLACEFMDNGWSVKELQRLIVTSATYKQSSKIAPQLLEKDPYNRLLARGPRFRVEGEIVRDIALAASGLLNPKLGGPSVMPPAPEFLFQPPASYAPFPWKHDNSDEKYRRGIYVFRRRSTPFPELQTFDVPNADASCVRRQRSNSPLQALVSLNEPLFVECSQALARKTLADGGKTDEQRIAYAFRRALSRSPQPDEVQELISLLGKEKQRIADGWVNASEVGAGTNSVPKNLPDGVTPTQLAAYTVVSRVLLNLDETITKE